MIEVYVERYNDYFDNNQMFLKYSNINRFKNVLTSNKVSSVYEILSKYNITEYEKFKSKFEENNTIIDFSEPEFNLYDFKKMKKFYETISNKHHFIYYVNFLNKNNKDIEDKLKIYNPIDIFNDFDETLKCDFLKVFYFINYFFTESLQLQKTSNVYYFERTTKNNDIYLKIKKLSLEFDIEFSNIPKTISFEQIFFLSEFLKSIIEPVLPHYNNSINKSCKFKKFMSKTLIKKIKSEIKEDKSFRKQKIKDEFANLEYKYDSIFKLSEESFIYFVKRWSSIMWNINHKKNSTLCVPNFNHIYMPRIINNKINWLKIFFRN